jgi:predicted peptidase
MRFYKLFFAIVIINLSCKEEDSNIPGVPNWNNGYPKVAVGATSADILLSSDKSATVYWLVTDKALISIDGESIKSEATTPTNSSIKSNGKIDIGQSTEVTQLVDNLKENTTYFVYVVAENRTDILIQPNANSSTIKTHIRQDVKTFQSTVESRSVSYLIYQPEDALKYPDDKYPILFFLGGNGEVAAQGEINMIRNGSLPEYISKGNKVPMIVMSIQHTKTSWNPNMIHEGVLHGLETYPVDKSKVYMTGISGGGFGCWDYAVDHASFLAAIVPISGGGKQAKACNLNSVAISAFHNHDTDPFVATSNSVDMVAAVNKCTRAEAATLLIFPDDGHDCWRRVYDQNHTDWSKSPGVTKFDIYAWLLTKSK